MAIQRLFNQLEMSCPKGTKYAIFHEVDIAGNDQGYGVWLLRSNYRSGKTIRTWRYIEKNMTADDARLLLLKKCKIKN